MKRARLFGALAALAALPPLALHTAAALCLRMVAKPKRWSETGMREQEIENGFGDCVEAYEKRWPREDFSIVRDGVAIRRATAAREERSPSSATARPPTATRRSNTRTSSTARAFRR